VRPRKRRSQARSRRRGRPRGAPPPTTLDALAAQIVAFRDARDWKRFHDPKDMALSLVLEAAELMEHVQWRSGKDLAAHLARRRAAVGDELSDVLYWVLLLAHDLGIDLAAAFHRKMRLNARKYPVAKARGLAAKYTELRRPRG